MTPKQRAKLSTLRDRLFEAALRDADPKNWAGGETAPKDMTREERGDAKWCRSLALSTVSLAMQVQRMVENEPAGAEQASEEDLVAAEVARFEKAAAELLAAKAVKTARARR